MDDKQCINAILSNAIICMLVLAVLVSVYQTDKLKQEAVDKGFAEWSFIPGTKETEFKWKDITKLK